MRHWAIKIKKPLLLLSAFSLFWCTTCADESRIHTSLHPPQGKVPTRDEWLLTGKLSDQIYQNGEVLALTLNGENLRSPINQSLVFGLELPGNSTYALYFLPPPLEGQDPKASFQAALYVFEDSPDLGRRDTLRLPAPAGAGILNLGEVDVQGSRAFSSINPASILDYDRDGLPDLKDADDENNGLSDIEEKIYVEGVVICHVPKGDPSKRANMRVPLSQVLEHLSHHDTIGLCPGTSSPPPAHS